MVHHHHGSFSTLPLPPRPSHIPSTSAPLHLITTPRLKLHTCRQEPDEQFPPAAPVSQRPLRQPLSQRPRPLSSYIPFFLSINPAHARAVFSVHFRRQQPLQRHGARGLTEFRWVSTASRVGGTLRPSPYALCIQDSVRCYGGGGGRGRGCRADGGFIDSFWAISGRGGKGSKVRAPFGASPSSPLYPLSGGLGYVVP